MRLKREPIRDIFEEDKAFKLWIDASTQKNGKKDCYGWSAVIDQNHKWLRTKAVNHVMSSNIAELYGYFMALQYIANLKDDNPEIKYYAVYTDSICIMNWLKKDTKKVACEHARKLLTKCHKLKGFLKICKVKVKLFKIGRESNYLADKISKGLPPENIKNNEIKFMDLRPVMFV
jgi:ribonuclease HI